MSAEQGRFPEAQVLLRGGCCPHHTFVFTQNSARACRPGLGRTEAGCVLSPTGSVWTAGQPREGPTHGPGLPGRPGHGGAWCCREGRLQGHVLVLNVLPRFTPGWSAEHSSWCHGLCSQAWSRAQWPIFSLVPLFTGLQPGPGVWEAGCGRGFAPLKWLHPCLASPGGGGWRWEPGPELQPVARRWDGQTHGSGPFPVLLGVESRR